MTSTNPSLTPVVDRFVLEYEEGYPDRPMIDVGADGTFDWESDIFLNESSVVATDDSEVGVIVKRAPTLVDAFNAFVPDNGDGEVLVPLAIKAASSGRVKISNIDITYAMQTRAVDASLKEAWPLQTACIATSSRGWHPETMSTT